MGKSRIQNYKWRKSLKKFFEKCSSLEGELKRKQNELRDVFYIGNDAVDFGHEKEEEKPKGANEEQAKLKVQ